MPQLWDWLCNCRAARSTWTTTARAAASASLRGLDVGGLDGLRILGLLRIHEAGEIGGGRSDRIDALLHEPDLHARLLEGRDDCAVPFVDQRLRRSGRRHQ